MLVLNANQTSYLLKRLPQFELSYETISHKKVSSVYDVCIAIPTGKKVLIWFTFYQKYYTCYIMELNRDKKIVKVVHSDIKSNLQLSMGTLVYATCVVDEHSGKEKYIVDDILFMKGVNVCKMSSINKFGAWKLLFECLEKHTPIYSPFLWNVQLDGLDEYPNTLDECIQSRVHYPLHHIQYRSSNEVMPYMNVHLSRKLNIVSLPNATKVVAPLSTDFEIEPYKMVFNKPQYRTTTVFEVRADLQYDIYHLFAYGRNNSPVYYNLSYVPNYKTSVAMNNLFRNIRENKNLDYIEESDDEDDFENIQHDKYVDLKKILRMECVYDRKYRKWTPIKVAHKYAKIVHISKL
jgi:hypothetical protein|uniref:mRNA capping enzyme adenylation domain-containing protein n=1 Tax=viral metagenome TaxID=1070528 RepID=A0A6C0IMD6_9ZZZZ